MSQARDDLRRSQDRDYAAVGVAMLLTLTSEVEPIPAGAPTARDAELAARVADYEQALFPGGADAPGLIGVLQAAALRDFDHSVLSARTTHGATG